MSYGSLDKSRLLNLEYSLFKEVLRTNRAGSYSSSSIIGCNTRKYHGFLVAPIPEFDYERHVLLSSVDVSVEQHGKSFNLGIHKYMGSHYDPRGHKYVKDFDLDPIPRIVYRVGGVVLQQELVLVENESQVLLRYTLLEANSPTTLKLKPFLGFRHIHDLTRENMSANTRYEKITGGIKLRLYEGFPYMHMQCNKNAEFVPVPDWYKGIEYIKEEISGFPYAEDLYVPGYFELPIEKGESIIFSAGTNGAKVDDLTDLFEREASTRIPRNSLLNNLLNAAQQFVINGEKGSQLMAGYYWYGPRLRDTLISLPGLSVYQEDKTSFKDILNSAIQQIKKEVLNNGDAIVKEVDSTLWLFWTLQNCNDFCDHNIWPTYGEILKEILEYHLNHNTEQLHVREDGLLHAKVEGIPLTWMDAISNGQPVTPRYGMAVEVNALWYNAIMFALSEASEAGDVTFAQKWQPIAEKVKENFMKVFWNSEKNCLFDCVDGDVVDASIRPNQIIAASLIYTPLERDQKKSVLDIVINDLLTPVGLRSLSPDHPRYQGVMAGYVREQKEALHQGTAYPWLLSFFAKTYLDLFKQGGVSYIQRIIDGFEKELGEHCLGTISECYNGNPPFKANGAVSMAWNVAGLLSVISLLETY